MAGGGYPLSDADMMKLAYWVRGLVRAEAKEVGEVPLVEDLNGIESFPTLQVVGGIAKMVRAPISLLSEPAWDAVKDHIENLEKAIALVETATTNAEVATQASETATQASREQTEKCKEAISLAIEVLSHPPIVKEDNILYVYDIQAHEYVSTGQNMKGNTFFPSYDERDGMLHWTNDGGLPNPDPVRVEGNVMFATFEIDWESGDLLMRTLAEYKGADFELDVNGNLNVII